MHEKGLQPSQGGGGAGVTPTATSTSSIPQLLCAADAQTAHPATSHTAPAHQTTGLRERGNDTSRSTGRSGRQNAATRRNMRRDDRVTVQGPVKRQQPDGMSHGGCPSPGTHLRPAEISRLPRRGRAGTRYTRQLVQSRYGGSVARPCHPVSSALPSVTPVCRHRNADGVQWVSG